MMVQWVQCNAYLHEFYLVQTLASHIFPGILLEMTPSTNKTKI